MNPERMKKKLVVLLPQCASRATGSGSHSARSVCSATMCSAATKRRPCSGARKERSLVDGTETKGWLAR